MKLTLENVRCFAKAGPVNVAPLTVLVGENSTGKSSFLAFTRIALDILRGTLTVNFNRDPFFLGAYDQIAHYRGGRGGRARSFKIKISQDIVPPEGINLGKAPVVATFSSEFAKRGAHPGFISSSFDCGPYHFRINNKEQNNPKFEVSFPSWKGTLVGEYAQITKTWFLASGADISYLGFILFDIVRTRVREKKDIYSHEDAQIISQLVQYAVEPINLVPFATAPVRTKPERTYDPIEDTPRSEGSHVPMVLAKTKFTDREKWNRVKTVLQKFGRASGMFQEINVRTLGHSESDPFQIIVKIAGPNANLIDVGYGVSQALPVIVDLITGDEPRHYLLQQPEVHLHPRAQSELGNILCGIVSNTKNKIMVETHSDFILDRIRMEVRDGNIAKEDVSILYFERKGIEIKIHQMEVDESGNLLGMPASYRTFFLDEEFKLFGAE